MMISSMDLFFRRDCAGGGGPAVDVPRVAFMPPVLFDVLVVAAGAVGCEIVGGAVDEAAPPNKLIFGASVEDVDSPLLPVVTVGSFVEAVVLGVGLLRLEKMPPPTWGEEVSEAMFLSPRETNFAPGAPNVFGAVIGACGESVEINESGVDKSD